MPFRRRSSTAPYEVMGAGPRAHAPSPTPGSAPVQPVISKAPGATGTPGASGATAGGEDVWAARRHAPVVMRVPRGWLAALGVAAVAVVALTYWVGFTRGRSQGIAAGQENVLNQIAQSPASPSTADGSNTTAVTPVVTPTPAPPSPAPSEQPQVFRGPQGQRQPGYCYYILLTSNQDGAGTLVKFLRDNGVDAGAFPVHNGRFYQVIALRGFRPDQLQSQERRDYESQLKSLGRRWKARGHGQSDLSDMYIPPEPYKGEPER